MDSWVEPLRRYWLQQGHEVASTSLLPLENGEGVVHLNLAQSPDKWPESRSSGAHSTPAAQKKLWDLRSLIRRGSLTKHC